MSIKNYHLFDEPIGYQWGLRGDPHFWEILKTHYSQLPKPVANQEEFLAEFEKVSVEYCGANILTSAENMLSVKNIPRGGMSGGWICQKYWKNTAVPELLKRLHQ